jgi:hypothetical protein
MSTVHSVPWAFSTFQLIPAAQEGVTAFNRSYSPAIPSRDAPAGRPVERRVAAADPSSRCASTGCRSSVHSPSSAVSAAVELPIRLFPSREPRHPSRKK